jgi:hypothetical protein
MDYKERFEDFINRMNGLLDEANKNRHAIVRVEDLENAFPELKKSEDEMIRKAIIKHFKVETEYTSFNGFSKNEIINYLEKQGEQKPIVVFPKFRVGDVIRPKGSMAEYTIESISGGCYHGKGWGLDIGYEENYELVEKNSSWSEEDEKISQWIITDITHLKNDHKKSNVIADKELDWLKSLKDKVQQKQEWSDDDNYKLYQIFAIIDDYRRFYTIKPSLRKALLKDLDNIEAWLKSLSPQNKWMPSEEQIKALEDSMSHH